MTWIKWLWQVLFNLPTRTHTMSDGAEFTLYDGEIVWSGNLRSSFDCKDIWRAVVLRNNGLLYPATVHMSLNGEVSVTSYEAVQDLVQAQTVALSYLPD